MSQTLRFDPGGRIDCLYTEAIDLRALGRLEISRATDIRFNPATQQWDVHDAATGQLLHSDPSREACLAWERDNMQVKAEKLKSENLKMPEESDSSPHLRLPNNQ